MSAEHKCEPEEKSTPFWWDCKHCGKMIDTVHCPNCQGTSRMRQCPSCKGTGVIKWEEVKK